MAIDISTAPSKPGVYLFKSAGERVIYVGKAKNLKNRIRSYFSGSSALDARKAAMINEIKGFSFIVTSNELEAWILESNLIKRHKPKFNVLLRDDKNYPYIKITLAEKWPRVEVVRRISDDGSLYFGPYAPAQAMWEAIAFIKKHFLIRKCNRNLDKPSRPCVQYQMRRCHAPCAGMISEKDYRKIVNDIALFLKGKKSGLVKSLEKRMLKYSAEMKYEEAARIRDSLAMLNKALESQKIVSPGLGDLDAIGFFRERGEGKAAVSMLFIRNGVMTGAKNVLLEERLGEKDSELLSAFFRLFYSGNVRPAPLILTPLSPVDKSAIVAWLAESAGVSIKISTPKEGRKRELLEMACENARVHLSSMKKTTGGAEAFHLADMIGLPDEPRSIAVFDVSTLSGSESAGGMIWWEDGCFRKDCYRHVKIKWVEGMDDYSMTRETIVRALSNLHDKTPDLVIVDGGKGQLDVACRALRELNIKAPAIAVAKKPDRAFLENGAVIDLQGKDSSSLLLRRLRDEAHRFIVTFHRKLRDKRLSESKLEKIPGVGKNRRLALLKRFGSIENIRNASVEEISEIKGLNNALAASILKYLNEEIEE